MSIDKTNVASVIQQMRDDILNNVQMLRLHKELDLDESKLVTIDKIPTIWELFPGGGAEWVLLESYSKMMQTTSILFKTLINNYKMGKHFHKSYERLTMETKGCELTLLTPKKTFKIKYNESCVIPPRVPHIAIFKGKGVIKIDYSQTGNDWTAQF